MESFDKMFVSALRDLDAGLQQAIYYAVFIDIFLLVSLGIFIWCCCAYVLNYRKLVDESVRVARSKKQYYGARAARERLEARKIKFELGLIEELDKEELGGYS